MKLLVIRHGESEADLLNVHEGRADFSLTVRGHKQAAAMADYVAENYSISKIYASTLTRAKQTARHLSDKTGVPIVLDENLMEFNNGLLAGLSRTAAKEKYPKIPNVPIDKAVYGQESQLAFRQRAENALARIIREAHPEETIAVVSHWFETEQGIHRVLGELARCGNQFVGDMKEYLL